MTTRHQKLGQAKLEVIQLLSDGDRLLKEDEAEELRQLVTNNPRICQSRLEFRDGHKHHLLHRIVKMTDSLELVKLIHELNPKANQSKAEYGFEKKRSLSSPLRPCSPRY